MNTLWDLGVTFTSQALDSHAVRVTEISGREELGRLYEFHVTFAVGEEPLTAAEIEKVLQSPCSFTLGAGEHDVIHGIVSELELAESVEKRAQVYVATVVPSVWLLTVSRLSRVFQKMTVAEMAHDILTRAGLGENDFSIRILTKGDKREFCVQYEESDWDFLQRWLEHEGYYYWFEHSATGERLVISDANQASRGIAGDTQLPYRDEAGLVRTEDSVFAWTSAHKRSLRRVVLRDYNEQNPGMQVIGQADVGLASGFGVYFAYGEHFDSADSGQRLAVKRAERLRVEHATFTGRTDCTRVRVGHTLELVDHFNGENNRKYLLTGITHYAGPLPSTDARASGNHSVMGYRATVDALPFDVQFRPPCATRWPRINGIMHAHVDSDTGGKFSTLNSQGRYRVRLPFDSAGNSGESASNWVRMAQSYAGAGYGTHFPLHKGTEVILAFVDGDPDRPIIVGAVPNAHTPSPSVNKNATQSVIRSASGIQFSMEDFHAPPPSSRGPN